MTVETTANIKVDKDMASWRSVAGCTGKRATMSFSFFIIVFAIKQSRRM